MKIAKFPVLLVVIPKADKGSIDPLTNTVRLNVKSNPPSTKLVQSIAWETNWPLKFGPKTSVHCSRKIKLSGKRLPNGWLVESDVIK